VDASRTCKEEPDNVLPGSVTFKIHDDASQVPFYIRTEMEDIFERNFAARLKNKGE
jgi:hypothetical protein